MYEYVTEMGPGGAVWIYASAPSSVKLTYAPSTARAPITLTISDLFQSGPFTVHVGDSIKLILPAPTLHRATVDSHFLDTVAAGLMGDLTCAGDPACAISLVNQFWTWQAVTAGTTTITVSPQCDPQCAQPSVQLQVVIQP